MLANVSWRGRMVHVLITHLDREKDGPVQRRAIRELFLSLSEPAVLMGDLNASGDDEQIARLRTAPGVEDALGRVLGATAGAHIDWIFLRGLRCRDAGLVDAGASDHPAAWAEVEMP